MISFTHAGVVYAAILTGCYDGDTCTVRFVDFPPPVAEQRVRFHGFDAPERNRPKCASEKRLAAQARQVTQSYMQGDVVLEIIDKREKYGRMLVVAPELKTRLINKGLAHPSANGRRADWCG